MEKKNGYKINPESINENFFRGLKKAKAVLKKREFIGTVIGLVGLATAFGMASSVSDKVKKESSQIEDSVENNDLGTGNFVGFDVALAGLGAKRDTKASVNSMNVSLDDVNSLNIVINDNKCSNAFFGEVCQGLRDDGVIFTQTENCENVDANNSVVISLDQLYMSGPGMMIFVPYDNERVGDSDALALAMETGFKVEDLETTGIFAGKVGYRELVKGYIQTRVPTSTEEAIGVDKNISFVTISFGTDNKNAKDVAQSIENGLARYVYYQREKENGEDLIYRVAGGDVMADIEERFYGSSAREIDYYNDLEYNVDKVYMNDTLRNPCIANRESFNEDSEIKLNIERARKY